MTYRRNIYAVYCLTCVVFKKLWHSENYIYMIYKRAILLSVEIQFEKIFRIPEMLMSDIVFDHISILGTYA